MATELRLKLPLEQPYNLAETLYSGQAFRWSTIQSLDEKSIYEGIIYGRRITLCQEKKNILVTGYPTRENPLSESELRGLINSYLRINDDLEGFYKRTASDEYLQSSIKTYRGLHLLKQEPWECLVAFICSANNNIPRIRLLMDRISAACGPVINDTKGPYNSFPDAKSIALLGESGLRDLGLGFRAKYVNHAAQIISQQQLNLKKLIGSPYLETYESLISIRGVGDKVANCVMLFSLDQDNSFPVDVWIRRVLREEYVPKEETVRDVGLREWAQKKFGMDSGYVNQYLFQKRRLETNV